MPSPPLPLPLLPNHSQTATSPPLPLRDPDAFQVLAREELHLRQSLQAAIDAQSEGLLAGFTTADATAATAPSSRFDARSPTGRRRRLGVEKSEPVSGRNGVVIPVRQPAPQRLGLQGARRGIARAMAQLEELKSHEGELLEAALVAHEEDMAAAEALGQKRDGLEASIRAIETEDSSRHVQELCDEERSLAEEIRNLETKLAGMKTRHRHLRAEIEGLDNRVQSQLSSYRAALALAEKETREFLARPPSGPAQTTTTASTKIALGSRPKDNQQKSLWDLPAGRRTLPMAQEQFRDEQRMLLNRIAEVDEERTALEEGKHVWAAVVQEVTGVERLLRDEMQRLDQPVPPRGLPSETLATAPALAGAGARARTRTEPGVGVYGEGEGEGDEGREEKDNAATHHSTHAILHHLDTARTRVEQHWRTSVSRQWGLLVCCVGAELEALVQGSAVLRAMLGGEDEGVGVGRNGEREGMDVDGHRDNDSDSDKEGLGLGSGLDRNGPDVEAMNSSPPIDAILPREGNSERNSKPDRDPDRQRDRGAEEEEEEDDDDDKDDGPGADLLGF